MSQTLTQNVYNLQITEIIPCTMVKYILRPRKTRTVSTYAVIPPSVSSIRISFDYSLRPPPLFFGAVFFKCLLMFSVAVEPSHRFVYPIYRLCEIWHVVVKVWLYRSIISGSTCSCFSLLWLAGGRTHERILFIFRSITLHKMYKSISLIVTIPGFRI